MSTSAEKTTSDGFLLRMRKQDTPTGISSPTIEQLMEMTGLTKTEVAHLALRQMADRLLPRYEMDDGPLTPAQTQAIRRASTATDIPEERFDARLF